MQTATQRTAIFKKVGIADREIPDAREVLGSLQVLPRVIQDFRPLCESLEWQLSEAYWRAAGITGFLRNEVPYTVNNSGSLSSSAAELLFASCLEMPPVQRLTLLEVGAGSGLFARFLLDEFRRVCEQHKKDYYELLRFYVTDGSAKTVEQWRSLELFSGHEQHVVMAACDARQAGEYAKGSGAAPLRAAFANYVLDSLPASVLRKGPTGPEEQYVRTHLGDPTRIAQHTRMTIEQIRALAGSNRLEDRMQLLPIASLLEFETEYRGVNGHRAAYDEALTFGHDAERIVLNYGAYESIESMLEALEPQGFILVNDYGTIAGQQVPAQGGSQRFGLSSAMALNFPLLEHHFTTRGVRFTTPERDDLLSVHPRLITPADPHETQSAFLRIFHGTSQRTPEEFEDEARRHIEAGRADKARDAFERALALRPRDWRLIGDLAEFVIRQVGDYQAGLRLAHLALAINPWYSVWLWNVLGDALFALDRFEEAHEAYIEAQRIEPSDVRTSLNLAYSYAQFGDYTAALRAIGEGLGQDKAGIYRQRLLEKQQHILTLAGQKWASEKEWEVRRMQRLAQ